MERLLPDPGPTSVAEQMAEFDPASLRTTDDRPFTYTNFAITLDGRATIDGKSGSIGSDTDTAMLVGLRSVADAIMIGAGTMRTERYGRLMSDPAKRAARAERGLSPVPLLVIVSGRLDLPWDAGAFTEGDGEVLIFTSSSDEPPETASSVEVVRHEGRVDVAAALRHLRTERGVRSLLCEGGPSLHGDLLEAGLVDELFVTHGPMLGGGDGPGLVAGLPAAEIDLELTWLLREGSELFARYAIRR